MRITLRQLAVFDAAARLGSVSGAAKEVHLTQSAASLALQELERSLAVQLFHRHRRKLALNENGRRLQPRARSVLMLAREIEGDRPDAKLSGVIRIAATPTIANYLLPATCSRFLDLHPDVQIKLTVANEPEIIDQVENLNFDVGFIEGVSMRHTLNVEPWTRDALAIIASPRHWAVGKRVSMTQLGAERWYLQPIGSATRHAFTNPYSWLLGSDSITLETNSIETIKNAIAAGEGIGCLSHFAVADEIARGRLKELSVKGFKIERTYNIISRRDVYEGSVCPAFLEMVRRTHAASATD